MRYKMKYEIKHLIVVFILTSFFASSGFTYQTDSRIVSGYSVIKTDTYDEWDKKKNAVSNAIKNLTFSLASNMMSGEEIEETKELINKNVIPYSNLYILKTNVIKHGVEKEGEYEAYKARVNFTYSMANFKKLLKSKGILFKNLAEPKVSAYIKVKDISRLKLFKWWEEDAPRLHPALIPIHKRLKTALTEQGFSYIGPIFYKSSQKVSPKAMAEKSGSHYYISGEVTVSDNGKPGSINLKNGDFYFHETRSQKLVSKLNVMDFKKAYEKTLVEAVADADTKETANAKARTVAEANSTADAPKKVRTSDVLTESFRKAINTMSVVGDLESLTQEATLLKIQGVNNAQDLNMVKESLEALSKQGLDRFVERSMTQGEVVFTARSKMNSRALEALIESQTALTNQAQKNSKGALVFKYDPRAQ